MNMIPVSSSNIHSIGYDNSNLYVRFNSGATYRYINVPENLYKNLMNASSKGSYLDSYIKGAYSYQKI